MQLAKATLHSGTFFVVSLVGAVFVSARRERGDSFAVAAAAADVDDSVVGVVAVAAGIDGAEVAADVVVSVADVVNGADGVDDAVM